MANEIKTKFIATDLFIISLASLATGSARQSTMINNSVNKYPAALIHLKIQSGAVAPTAGTFYEAYLLRGDNPASSTFRTDGAGPSDSAITIENARLLGVIIVTATANKYFYVTFDTFSLGPLGPEWGIAIKNSSGQALSATAGNHLTEYAYYIPEVQ